ncbi:hypothetical protein KUTeg_022823 [Tegillarca granosa]|uniref:Uncharacterized protein n=1 Tax=Tegillarca granosa TaxID=220873 RepID=A0ABQ9DZV2_TEGGR|nr:hypothetical protein KUTeg_022823 [Tegillarca granosa]
MSIYVFHFHADYTYNKRFQSKNTTALNFSISATNTRKKNNRFTLQIDMLPYPLQLVETVKFVSHF